MEKPFYAQGLQFSCRGLSCSACCRKEPGIVYLEQKDLETLSVLTELTIEQFKKVYCRYVELSNGKKVLCLKELSNYDCIFWNEQAGCQVYKARPIQCRTYPFWKNVLSSKESWLAEKQRCPGINEGELHSCSQIQKDLSEYNSRKILTE